MVFVSKIYIKLELKDKIFNFTDLDRNEYLLELKWIYKRCTKNWILHKLRNVRDVKCFF